MIQGFSGGLLNRQLIYNLDLPSFQRDFASLKTLNHGTGPNIATTDFRNSQATYFDANGIMQTAAINEPRFDHDPATGSSLGLLIEESRTNSIRNSQAGGSTSGVIGSGGVMPTNWSIGSGLTSNGISAEVIGTGTSSGLAYIDIKVSGTPTTSAGGTIRPEPTSQTTAVNGQTWTISAYVALTSGSTTNATVRIGAIGNNGSADVSPATETTFTPTSAALATQRRSATITLNDASITRVGGYVVVSYTSGNPIDLTLRIAAPQLEKGSDSGGGGGFATSYIPTTTAAATRSADIAVVTPISSFYNQSEGTLFAEGIVPVTTIGFPNFIALGGLQALTFSGSSSRAATNFGTGFNAQYGPTLTRGAIYRQAFAWATNNASGAANGTLGTDATSYTVATGITAMRLGSQSDSTNFYNSHIRKIAYYPKRLTNTLLQQLTT